MQKHWAATIYLVSKVDGVPKVLLHQHKKLHKWLGIGGHVKNNENPAETIVRETKEETGIDLRLIADSQTLFKGSSVKVVLNPFCILEEQIPAREDVPAHIHLDCVYFGEINNPEKVKMPEEFKWFSLSELDNPQIQNDVKYLATQALENAK